MGSESRASLSEEKVKEREKEKEKEKKRKEKVLGGQCRAKVRFAACLC